MMGVWECEGKMRLIAIAAITVLLAGCAPATLDGVRQMGESRQYVFEAPIGYESAYRTVLSQARKCFQTGMITAQMVVQGDLYRDIDMGTVSVALHGGFGVDTYQVIDITPAGSETSRIEAHYSLGNVQKQGDVLKAWVLRGAQECDGSDAG